MSTNETLKNTYHILVTEQQDHHTIEWSGNLTLSTQENGEIFIDLSFDEQPVEYSSDK